MTFRTVNFSVTGVDFEGAGVAMTVRAASATERA